jgi:hypothetical protein
MARRRTAWTRGATIGSWKSLLMNWDAELPGRESSSVPPLALLSTARMFSKRLLWGILFVAAAFFAPAQTTMPFKLNNGVVLNGQPLTPKDQFIMVKVGENAYTNLFWTQLSQETLRELEKNKSFAPYAAVFIDPPPSRPEVKTGGKAVTIKPVTRMDRPRDGGFFASPVMIAMLFLVWAANIYAGYEISVFRQQPPALVCVAAGILPIIGPAIFLAMPTRQQKQEPAWEAPVETAPVEEVPVTEEPPPPPSQEQPAFPPPVVYPRGQFVFNRRFFETKFAGFLKMVPGEAERDKVIHIKSARGEYTGHRLSKVDQNDLSLQIRKGAATEDVTIPFTEIYEVTVKHKDAP